MNLSKQALVDTVRRCVQRQHGGQDLSAACLYFAVRTCRLLRQHGVRAILQAGDAQWPRLRPEQDDGIRPTHFGYVWEPDSITTRLRLAAGLLPELHCWAALPQTQQILDLTTGDWPKRCRQVLGCDWPGDRPPDYLWCRAEELPKGVIYRPDLRAIQVVLGCLSQSQPQYMADVL